MSPAAVKIFEIRTIANFPHKMYPPEEISKWNLIVEALHQKYTSNFLLTWLNICYYVMVSPFRLAKPSRNEEFQESEMYQIYENSIQKVRVYFFIFQ